MDGRIAGFVENITEKPVFNEGDFVVMIFFDGCFTYFQGKLQEDGYGKLYIPTDENSVGYIENAYAIFHAVDDKGWVLWADEDDTAYSDEPMKKDNKKWLWGAPMLIDKNAIDYAAIMDSSQVSEESAEHLRKIASRLGCQLF